MESILWGVILVLALWLVAITYLYFHLRSTYALITRDGDKLSLAQILESMTSQLDKSHDAISHLSKRCDSLEKDEKNHIQKIGLLRYNPFKDTGGDQSFVLSLVDANENGIVVSGLYSRSGTRWYAKKIENGKGIEYDLSEEEQKALKLAKS